MILDVLLLAYFALETLPITVQIKTVIYALKKPILQHVQADIYALMELDAISP